MPPDFLAIGHVAKDLTAESFTLGGAVTYAAHTTLQMGMAAAVVTSVEPELDLPPAMPGVQVHAIPSPETTTFQNSYLYGKRTQLLKAVGGPIAASDVPAQLSGASHVMLCPLGGEVGHDLAQGFPNATVVASIQGWLRRWDSRGRVSPAHWEGREVLHHVDAAIFSIEDVGDRGLIEIWKCMAPVLIMTMGIKGARIHVHGEWHHVKPFPTREVDPTGAGDVFGAAYLIRYRETADPLESARFASCAASFCVESKGVSGVPTRAQVEERLRSAT